MPTAEEIKAAEDAAIEAAAAKAKADADELAATGITTDAGKEALRKEREARRTAEKAAKDANDRAAALEAKQTAADEAKRIADEKAAEEQGQYKTLAEQRAADLAAAKVEKDAAEAKAEKAIKLITATVDTKWESAPASVLKLYKGDDTDVLAKQEFLDDHAELIADLTQQTEKQNQAFRNIPRTPQPNGDTPIDAAMDQARRSGKYKV